MATVNQPIFSFLPRWQQIEADYAAKNLGSDKPFGLDDDSLAILEDRDRQLESFLTQRFSEAAPAGMISMMWGTVAPRGWLAMEGQTVVNAEALYPNLWAFAPAGSKSGSNLILPNTKGRLVVGRNASDTSFDTLGETGGAKTKTLTTANLAAHTHTGPSHTHGGFAGGSFVMHNVGAGSVDFQTISGNAKVVNSVTAAAGTGASGSAGSGTAFDIMNPYIVFVFIVRAF